jgi:hypothetical protein
MPAYKFKYTGSFDSLSITTWCSWNDGAVSTPTCSHLANVPTLTEKELGDLAQTRIADST